MKVRVTYFSIWLALLLFRIYLELVVVEHKRQMVLKGGSSVNNAFEQFGGFPATNFFLTLKV